MKATELRLGNLFYFDCDKLPNGKLLCEICDINHLKVVGLSFSNKSALITNYVYKIEPIFITEDWLVKFGFNNRQKEIDGQIIEINENECFYLFGLDSCTTGQCFSGKIEYIHQLQNLYFALTGEELELI